MLLKCPDSHDIGCSCREKIPSNGLCSKIESNPLKDFGGVVCTSHIVEKEPWRNLVPAFPIRCSQILQDEVAVEIWQLADDGNRKTHIHLFIVNRGVEWVVDKVCDEGSESPVVQAVAIHVCKWRCRMTKSVDEECLKFTLCIVEAPRKQCVGLNRVCCCARGKAKISVHLGVIVKDGVNEQWPQIFKEKQSFVSHLGSQVFENHLWLVSGEAVL